LIRVRESCNWNMIDAANGKIKQIRDQMLNEQSVSVGVSIEEFQELCDKCDKLFRVKEQLGEIYQQKYEAKQEARPFPRT